MSKKNTKKSNRKSPTSATEKPAAAGAPSPRVSGRGATAIAAATKGTAPTARTAKRKQGAAPGNRAAAGAAPQAGAPAAGSAPSQRDRDARLPPVGTVLVKRDRSGRTRCECKIEEAGFKYGDTVHPSLSAAASAAATDLGIQGRVNGFVFWGLIKPPRAAGNPAEYLRKIAARYTERAATFLSTEGSPAERDEVRRELRAHTAQLTELLAKAAA